MTPRERARAAPVARPAGWSDPAFARVAGVVHLVSGLVFPPNRQPSAEAAMRRAMSSLRIASPDALGQAVDRPGEARDTLLAELTVGETYFFREAGQLEVLRTDVLPGLLAARGLNRPLRIWSAGCASGEEPYTLAIMLRELGWPHPARILGTDVARPRLDAARRGRYTRWSLRGVSDARIARWFERRGSHFQLDPAIRAAVEFSTLNLVDDAYPAAATGTLDQDIVLCRNVLIYFDMTTVEQIATRLLESLAPDGWLLCGASDPPLFGLVPCEAVTTPGGVVYRRADRDPARAGDATHGTSFWQGLWSSTPTPPEDVLPALVHVELLPVAEPPPAAPRLVLVAERPDVVEDEEIAAYDAADYARAEQLARVALERDASRTAPWVVLVRSLANQGRLRDADAECMRALDGHRLSPELHCLHATLLGAAGQHGEAAKAARRALYLDRQFVMAHLQLGDSLAHLGDLTGAARAFENALAGLSALADDERVLAGDGVPASRMRQVADLRLRGMQSARAS